MNTSRDIRDALFADPDGLHAQLCADLQSIDKIRGMFKQERRNCNNPAFRILLAKRIARLLDDRKRITKMIHLAKRVRTNKTTTKTGLCEKTTAQHFVDLCRKEMSEEDFERLLQKALSMSFDGKMDNWNRPDPTTVGLYP